MVWDCAIYKSNIQKTIHDMQVPGYQKKKTDGYDMLCFAVSEKTVPFWKLLVGLYSKLIIFFVFIIWNFVKIIMYIVYV